VIKGYRDTPESGADAVAGEWFSTGEIGWVDEDGYFFLVTPHEHVTFAPARSGLRACTSRQAIVSRDIGRASRLLIGT
jgi:acyl-CoA synthetase (AMP-forming)/AMP-acid ligase II